MAQPNIPPAPTKTIEAAINKITELTENITELPKLDQILLRVNQLKLINNTLQNNMNKLFDKISGVHIPDATTLIDQNQKIQSIFGEELNRLAKIVPTTLPLVPPATTGEDEEGGEATVDKGEDKGEGEATVDKGEDKGGDGGGAAASQGGGYRYGRYRSKSRSKSHKKRRRHHRRKKGHKTRSKRH